MPRGRAVCRDPGNSLGWTRAGGIPGRPVPETVQAAAPAGRVEFKRPAPGRSGGGRGTRGATEKAPIPELRNVAPPHAPPPPPPPTSPQKQVVSLAWLMDP